MNEASNYNKDEEKKMMDDFRFAFNPPTRKQHTRTNRESLKLSPNHTHLFLGSYPKKVNNDNKKFVYLKKLLRTNEITPDRFVDFAKILRIKDKEEKIYVTVGEIIQLF